MLDGHVHIENQPYTIEFINNVVNECLLKGIDEINLLDHTHKFKEFSFLYSTLKDEDTIAWYKKKNPISIKEYLDFIDTVKKLDLPIKINFGLEVCYFKEHKLELIKMLKKLPKFDFLVGSIHFVDGIGIDLNKDIFSKYNIHYLYERYFYLEEDLARSHLFTILAHPDEIKLFSPKINFSLIPYYESLAKTLKKNNQITENNSGLIRYGFPYPGLDKDLEDIFRKYDIKFVKSSDAHNYKDIGRVFEKISNNI